jgi:acetolactate synthase-1/2/3 large subunit
MAAAIAGALNSVSFPILVDDSQMLGGLIARHYQLLPASTRVLASHGGFVGSGLSTAAGAAKAGHAVLCLLGDQGFTNGAGALAAVAELDVPLAVIVCDNGGSQSLRTQAAADDVDLGSLAASLLGNCEQMDHAAIAAGYGITAMTMHWPAGPECINQAGRHIREAVSEALTAQRPFLLHLITPRTSCFWSGIWNTAGFDA